MRRFTLVFLAVLHSSVITKAQDQIQFKESDEGNQNTVQASEAESNFKCGESNPGALTLRFQTTGDSEFGEFPWMVAILTKTSTTPTNWSDEEYVSAGTLIHPSVVLASCRMIGKNKANELKCRAGEWDKSSLDEEYPHQERNVRRIVKHQDFFETSVYNSVCVVFLEQPFTLTNAPHIGVACVGQALPEPGTQCFGAGWRHSDGVKNDLLKKIPVTLSSSEDCETKLRETRVGETFILHDSLTCASSAIANNTCKGDPGAPLVCPVKNDSTRYVLYGMSAYRIGNAPCVYVKVPAFYNWIGDRMAEEGFNSKTYTYLPE